MTKEQEMDGPGSSQRTLTGFVSGDRHLSLDEMTDRAMRGASVLAAAGVRAGHRVALLMRNDLPFIEASYAISHLGAIPVPINWHGTAGEVGAVIDDAGASVAIVHADLVDVLPASVRPFVVDVPADVAAAYGGQAVSAPAERSWVAALDAAEPTTAPPQPAPPSMIYTSGTTGQPKGVRRLQALDMTSPDLQATFKAIGVIPQMRTVVCGPMYHSAPNAFALTAGRMGGLVVLTPRFDAQQLLELIERYAITTLHLVPTMMSRLLALPAEVRARYDTSTLRVISHAAAPCPPEVKRACIEWFGPIVNEYYGGTEIGAVVACDSQEWLAHPGTVGRPLPGCTVRIFGEDGSVLGPGEIGEVYAFNDAYGDFTYENRPEAREDVERDGLLSVGDVGYLDEDGFLYLTDRKANKVISGGVNIFPQESENLLLDHEAVADAAVFGVPDPDLGERLHAVVQPRDPAAAGAGLEAELMAYLLQTLPKFKCPRSMAFRDELPRQDSGKLFKRKLREEYLAEQGTPA